MANRNIQQIVDFVRYIVRKERGVFITIPQATSNLDAAQLDVFQDYFKQYLETQTIHDALKPFKKYVQFTTDSAGFLTYESDVEHILGTVFTVSGSTMNEVRIVAEDKYVKAVNSVLRPVSITKPIGKYTATGISIVPQTTQTGFYNYLKRPATPVYAYTQVGRDITYDAANSTQLEWQDTYINSIIARALWYTGVNMDEKSISDFAQQYEQEAK